MVVVAIKTYNLEGKELESFSMDGEALQKRANPQMIKDYLVAYRHNQRQWSANTKGRSELSYSGQKPHRQKGTGKARQGYIGAAQYRGGSVIFGPKPKFDQKKEMNKKQKRAVIRTLLAEKVEGDSLSFLQLDEGKKASLESPRTKTMAQFLHVLGLEGKRVLFIGRDDASYDTLIKSLRNIPKVSFKRLSALNGYDLALHTTLIVEQSAKEGVISMWGEENDK